MTALIVLAQLGYRAYLDQALSEGIIGVLAKLLAPRHHRSEPASLIVSKSPGGARVGSDGVDISGSGITDGLRR